MGSMEVALKHNSLSTGVILGYWKMKWKLLQYIGVILG